ncbi:MAG: RluA family pseudouridine synthase [Tepidisphaeraceae bacterium]|jgi:23S rRNA pseudouridine1911/1915/1917 synthase
MLLLERLLNEFPSAKRQTLKRMLQAGRVTVNGVPATHLKQTIGQKDVVRVDAPQKTGPIRLPFPIVYEDDEIIVIDKPAGLLTSTVAREPRPTALAALRGRGRVGLIHRLDRDASGLLVFSKTTAALASLKSQFFHHSATRIYQAIVSPPPPKENGTVKSVLSERTDGTVHSIHSRGKLAITHYQQIRRVGELAILRVTLETGKKHQIRAHLSEMGAPIVGDSLYGGLPHRNGLMLAAVELQIEHPLTKKRMVFRIDPPKRMKV